MPDFKLDIPIVESKEFFNISPSALSVSGPLNDLSIQVTFYDDYVSHSQMTVTAQQAATSPKLNKLELMFNNEPVRVAYGRIKLTLAVAKELQGLLDQYVKATEDVKAQAGRSG